MNIYQNNTYRKDLSWLHFYLEPMIQELVAARSTSLDMTTVFHTWPYDRFIDTEQPNSISPPPSFCWWDNFQFQILGIRKKNECLGGTYRVQVINICQAGFTMFLVKKSFLNVKFGFEGSISNVGYGLF